MRYYLISSDTPVYISGTRTSHNPPLHIHHHAELLYIREGGITLSVGGSEYRLAKGDLAVIFPLQPHSIKGGERDWLLVNVVPGFCPDYRDIMLNNLPREPVICGLEGSEIERLLHTALDEYSRGGEFSERITRGYLSAALGLIVSKTGLEAAKKQYSDIIEQIVRYCGANYTSPLTLATLASELHLSRSYVSRLFSDGMKVRFNDYINGLRVHHACSLLNNTDMSVTEIALVSGFENVRTFNRAFDRVWDMTPTMYRVKGRRSEMINDT